MPVLAVDGLSIAFGATPVVHGVSFAVEAGRTLAIVGESGSGKSASLLGATGLLPPSATVKGSVLHRGEQILGLPAARLRRLRGSGIGFVFQDPLSNLHPLKSVGVQIGEAITAHPRPGEPRLSRKALRARVLHLLDAVGIRNPSARVDDYPRQFSGGMRQRVMIAIAIANNPALIIADEPTTALDVTVQAAILDLLKRIQQEHRSAMIFVSHDLAVVSDIADDVLVMRHGLAVEKAPAQAIYASPRHAYTRELLGAARLKGLDLHAPARKGQPGADAGAAALLTVSGVWRSFAGRSRRGGALVDPVLQDISFSIRENEIVGLVGESGSGKSTIGRLVAGLDRPDDGTIGFRGQVYSQPGAGGLRIDRALRSSIQVIFQDPYASLNPRQRIGTILAEPFLITGARDRAAIRQRVHALARSVELPEEVVDRFPAQLSGGQRQRVAIARAIALRPSLIVADEPVSALDITTQRRIIALLGRLQEHLGVAFLFISHDLGVIAELCHRVIVLEHGRIVETGDTPDVFGNPRHAYTLRLVEAVPGRPRRTAAPADAPVSREANARKGPAHVG